MKQINLYFTIFIIKYNKKSFKSLFNPSNPFSKLFVVLFSKLFVVLFSKKNNEA